MHAVLNNKIITIHHGESNSEAFWAEPGKHACNTVGFMLFEKPIPKSVTYIIGVQQRMNDVLTLTEMVRNKRKRK